VVLVVWVILDISVALVVCMVLVFGRFSSFG